MSWSAIVRSISWFSFFNYQWFGGRVKRISFILEIESKPIPTKLRRTRLSKIEQIEKIYWVTILWYVEYGKLFFVTTFWFIKLRPWLWCKIINCFYFIFLKTESFKWSGLSLIYLYSPGWSQTCSLPALSSQSYVCGMFCYAQFFKRI